MANNLVHQAEEMEVMESIYGDRWQFDERTDTYSIDISANIKLYITLNPDYPSKSPPAYDLLAPVLTGHVKKRISEEFETIYRQNYGGPIIFQWVELLKEVSQEAALSTKSGKGDVFDSKNTKECGPRYPVIHGQTTIDRKSVFQGHCSRIETTDDIERVMDYLLKNNKIKQAKHNIRAYRIQTSKGVVQDCDDDGERHASGRILHLLQVLDVKNVLVVVTRWYGGVHIGPDRFKHYNNAAREVLKQAGFVKSK